jgi:hypothetical protein
MDGPLGGFALAGVLEGARRGGAVVSTARGCAAPARGPRRAHVGQSRALPAGQAQPRSLRCRRVLTRAPRGRRSPRSQTCASNSARSNVAAPRWSARCSMHRRSARSTDREPPLPRPIPARVVVAHARAERRTEPHLPAGKRSPRSQRSSRRVQTSARRRRSPLSATRASNPSAAPLWNAAGARTLFQTPRAAQVHARSRAPLHSSPLRALLPSAEAWLPRPLRRRSR